MTGQECLRGFEQRNRHFLIVDRFEKAPEADSFPVKPDMVKIYHGRDPADGAAVLNGKKKMFYSMRPERVSV